MAPTLTETPDTLPQSLGEGVLIELEGLVRELRPGESPRVHLDALLERDLGLDSLARAELLLRVERRLGLAFPEAALQGAETPRDLLRYAGLASGRAPPAVEANLQALASDSVRCPEGVASLVEVLEWHGAVHPQRLHVRLLEEGGGWQDLSYGGLLKGAQALAGGLGAQGLEPGESVALMLPTSLDYFRAFFGVMMAGGVPVPIYPPARPSQLGEHLHRHGGILANARCAFLLTDEELRGVGRLLGAQVPTLRGVLNLKLLVDAPGSHPIFHPEGRNPAFLQYTSGSTGDPKGVVLSHANLLANIRAMGRVVGLDPSDVFVSWLPLYHDMGLIGAWMASLLHGYPLVLMSPLAFLRDPSRWLSAIHHHRGTLTAAPNFAYDLCARKVPEEALSGLDLGSLRYACNGAEPVRPNTLEAFEGRFRHYGLRSGVLSPVYGLAEGSLGLTLPIPGQGGVLDRVRPEPFHDRGRAEPAHSADEKALVFVGCGRVLPGHALRVVDAWGAEVGEREVGRLHFKGPSATAGYFRNPTETARLFQGEWLDTGDHGYLADGELFVTGRVKDVIIRGGRNFYPYELEEAVGNLPGVRRGCVAAFGALDPASGTERLVLVAETKVSAPEAREALRARILETAVRVLGTPPDEILLARPHAVLKTSSGKIRRLACRSLYERGALGAERAALIRHVAVLVWEGAGIQVRRGVRKARELAFGAWAWGILGFLLLPLGICAWLSKRPARVWAWGGAGARFFLWATGTPLRVQGALPEGPLVVVANHASYLDGLVLMAALQRPMAFVAKAELATNPLVARLLRGLGVFFVERFDAQQAVLDAAVVTSAVAGGQAALFFPEGTFQRAPGLLPFHLGAFQAAAQAGAPIVPVALRGTRAMLPDRAWSPRPGALRVEILAPLAPEGSDWAATADLMNRTRECLLRASREPDLRDVPSPLLNMKLD